MKRFMTGVKNFLQEEEGLTVVEYAIAGALVSAVVVLAFTTLGNNVCGRINQLATIIATGTDPGFTACGA